MTDKDAAIDILARAMYEVVERDSNRKQGMSVVLQKGASEAALREQYESLTMIQKYACSRRAKSIAEDMVAQDQEPAKAPEPGKGMVW
jgi:hypothetical protein